MFWLGSTAVSFVAFGATYNYLYFYPILTDFTVDFIVLYFVSLFEMSFVNKVFLSLYPQEEDN